jgi:hypothetical protein
VVRVAEESGVSLGGPDGGAEEALSFVARRPREDLLDQLLDAEDLAFAEGLASRREAVAV